MSLLYGEELTLWRRAYSMEKSLLYGEELMRHCNLYCFSIE